MAVAVTESFYIQFPGIHFPEIKKGRHAGWLEIDEIDWGCGLGVSRRTKAADDKPKLSDPSISSVSINRTNKIPSQQTPLLFYNVLKAKNYEYVTLECVVQPYNKIAYSYRLEFAAVDGYSQSFGKGQFSESFSILFNKITSQIRQVDSYIEQLNRRKEIVGKYKEGELKGDVDSPFKVLAAEHVCILFSWLDTEDLANVSACCKRFMKISCDPRLLRVLETTATYNEHSKRATYNEATFNV